MTSLRELQQHCRNSENTEGAPTTLRELRQHCWSCDNTTGAPTTLHQLWERCARNDVLDPTPMLELQCSEAIRSPARRFSRDFFAGPIAVDMHMQLVRTCPCACTCTCMSTCDMFSVRLALRLRRIGQSDAQQAVEVEHIPVVEIAPSLIMAHALRESLVLTFYSRS